MSLGGAIATDFVLAHPERAATLVLIATSIGGGPLPGVIERLVAVARLVVDSGTNAGKRRWLHDFLLTPAYDTVAVSRLVLECSCPQLGNLQLFPKQGTPPAFARLEQVQIPTIQSRGTPMIPI